MKNEFDKGIEAVKKAADDIRDAITESAHRTAAEGEHAKRDVAGSEMTAGEKVGSVANEAKEKALAEVDRAKREVRDHT